MTAGGAEDVDTAAHDAQPVPLWQRALTLVGLASASALAGLLVVGVISFFDAGQFPVSERVPSNDLFVGDNDRPGQADADPVAEPGTTGTELVEASGDASAAGGSSGVVAGGRADVPAELGGDGAANTARTERRAAPELLPGSPPSAAAGAPWSANGAARPRAGVGSPPAEEARLKPVSPVPWLSATTASAAAECCVPPSGGD